MGEAEASRGPATVVVDTHGAVRAWNDTAQRMLGRGSPESMAQTLHTLWADQASASAWRQRQSARSWTASLAAAGREGDDLRLSVHAQPLQGLDVEPLWVLSVRPAGDGTDDTGPGSHDRLVLMNEASARIGTTLDIHRTADELAAVGIDHFADFTLVELLDSVLRGEEARPAPGPERMLFRCVAHRSVLDGRPEAAVSIGATQLFPKDSPVGVALATGRGSHHRRGDDSWQWWEQDAQDRPGPGTAASAHSLMVVPLQARGVILGVVLFGRHRTRAPFTDEDLVLAEEFAALAAVCVDNARRYTREHHAALALQRGLLPHSIDGKSAVDSATRYLPAASPAGLGGDWYDVVPLSGARVALVVGDVAGHGLHAAAAMGQLRTAVRTLADVDLPPDELLTQLNDVVIRLEKETAAAYHSGAEYGFAADEGPAVGEFSAACLYVVYDPVAGRCSAASAGNVPPVLLARGEAPVPVDVPIGPPLGVGGYPFELAEFDVPEGSRLALFTKGLLRALDEDPDSAVRTAAKILDQPSLTLEQVSDALLKHVPDEGPTDDVALLLACTRLLAHHQVATWEVAADPAAVPDLRRAVTGQLATWGLDELALTTELVASELVTNAIRYGGGPIELRLIRDTTLICEVSDGSNTAPHLRRARDFDEGGRGLLLVAQLTDRWGSRQGRRGKTIWAEQPLPGHTGTTIMHGS
ncbi:ATP-binding SpoIIE family protein phosphatase [Actinacidiphila rubida]|uniref:Serine phosphatase RsbU, regulator of sigma subunit n=1 Tax=Actinacidiphila rubida TaxID=310780 RepID=A0A1H8KKD5_9ACTN|nr:SpoIIE family protein phosphatase [Actinacidiphila rubida]SEN92868.1 Serine phosphatase RsbU, regulator of sigma subunit [Actinacidiphila rubida]